jgi:hypothetical protein
MIVAAASAIGARREGLAVIQVHEGHHQNLVFWLSHCHSLRYPVNPVILSERCVANRTNHCVRLTAFF